jgi:hypothetical protein
MEVAMMNKFYLPTILFFTLAVSVSAQDIIVLTDGNMIEAKVEEISPTEIKYRRFDNLNGPLNIINKSDVYSIKYENGTVEVINAAPSSAPQSPSIPPPKTVSPVLDPNKFYFSLSLEPFGLLVGGPSATAEFSKGAFNSLFHVSFPTLDLLKEVSDGFGFGLGVGINYFWNSKIGGFYLGGMFEWNTHTYSYLGTYYHPYYTYDPVNDTYIGQSITEEKETYAHNFIFAANIGYKFVTKSGIYFRTGIAAGVSLSNYLPVGFYYKPDIATGYIF